ncbi:hypothetical protein FHX09_005487 [Rhizobium sp. BK538]|nr:hypothetical protein [Rhizobium sp. BK538]
MAVKVATGHPRPRHDHLPIVALLGIERQSGYNREPWRQKFPLHRLSNQRRILCFGGGMFVWRGRCLSHLQQCPWCPSQSYRSAFVHRAMPINPAVVGHTRYRAAAVKTAGPYLDPRWGRDPTDSLLPFIRGTITW